MDEFDVTDFSELTKGRHGEPMAMLPTLPLAQRMAELLGNRQEVLQVDSHFEPLSATLPEALWRFSFLLYEMKRRK